MFSLRSFEHTLVNFCKAPTYFNFMLLESMSDECRLEGKNDEIFHVTIQALNTLNEFGEIYSRGDMTERIIRQVKLVSRLCEASFVLSLVRDDINTNFLKKRTFNDLDANESPNRSAKRFKPEAQPNEALFEYELKQFENLLKAYGGGNTALIPTILDQLYYKIADSTLSFGCQFEFLARAKIVLPLHIVTIDISIAMPLVKVLTQRIAGVVLESLEGEDIALSKETEKFVLYGNTFIKFLLPTGEIQRVFSEDDIILFIRSIKKASHSPKTLNQLYQLFATILRFKDPDVSVKRCVEDEEFLSNLLDMASSDRKDIEDKIESSAIDENIFFLLGNLLLLEDFSDQVVRLDGFEIAFNAIRVNFNEIVPLKEIIFFLKNISNSLMKTEAFTKQKGFELILNVMYRHKNCDALIEASANLIFTLIFEKTCFDYLIDHFDYVKQLLNHFKRQCTIFVATESLTKIFHKIYTTPCTISSGVQPEEARLWLIRENFISCLLMLYKGCTEDSVQVLLKMIFLNIAAEGIPNYEKYIEGDSITDIQDDGGGVPSLREQTLRCIKQRKLYEKERKAVSLSLRLGALMTKKGAIKLQRAYSLGFTPDLVEQINKGQKCFMCNTFYFNEYYCGLVHLNLWTFNIRIPNIAFVCSKVCLEKINVCSYNLS